MPDTVDLGMQGRSGPPVFEEPPNHGGEEIPPHHKDTFPFGSPGATGAVRILAPSLLRVKGDLLRHHPPVGESSLGRFP